MQFQEEAAGIAQDGAQLISAPERSGRGTAILANRLYLRALVSKDCGHNGDVSPHKNDKKGKKKKKKKKERDEEMRARGKQRKEAGDSVDG